MKTTERYNSRGQSYNARPSYPDGLVANLMEKTGLKPGDIVMDIGAGHGLLTGQILEAGLEAYAVEPSDMRQQAETRLGHLENFHSIQGEATNPNIPDNVQGSIKAIFVGQALHWWRKDFKEAVEAWHGVTTENPKLIAITYHFNDDDIFNKELDDMLISECPNYTKPPVKLLYHNSPGFSDEEYGRYFDPSDTSCERIALDFTLNEESFRALMTSFSFTPNPNTDPDALEEILGKSVEIFEKHAQDGHVTVPYTLKAWHGTLIQPEQVIG